MLTTPERKFLMFLSRFEPGVELPPRWILPGGGVELGETLAQAALRELWEETGRAFDPLDLGPVIHQCAYQQEWLGGEHDTGEAHFYVYPVGSEFEPDPTNWTAEEIRDTVQHRWFSYEELIEGEHWVGPDGIMEVLGEWFARASGPTPN